MPSPTNQSLEGENLSNPQQSDQVSTKFFYMALMMCVSASLWILYICHKVNQEFATFSQSELLQVESYLKGTCPNGKMSMMGKYRRNAITFKENMM